MRLFQRRMITQPQECPMCAVYRSQNQALREQLERDGAVLLHARQMLREFKDREQARERAAWEASCAESAPLPEMAVSAGAVAEVAR